MKNIQRLNCISVTNETEQGGADHDAEDHGRGLYRTQQDIRQMLQAQGLVNAERNKEGIHRAHSRRFRRCERAGVDAAHDNDRQQQAPDGAFQRIHPFRPIRSAQDAFGSSGRLRDL